MAQQPESPELFKAMKSCLSSAMDKAELDALVVMYIFDMSYSRADICLAVKQVEKENGW